MYAKASDDQAALDIEIRQPVPRRAIRGNSISVSSALPPS